MTNGIPLYERTINKNAPKQSAKEVKRRIEIGVVTACGTFTDTVANMHAKAVYERWAKMLTAYDAEAHAILGLVGHDRRKLRSLPESTRRRLVLVETQFKRVSEGMAALNTILEM